VDGGTLAPHSSTDATVHLLPLEMLDEQMTTKCIWTNSCWSHSYQASTNSETVRRLLGYTASEQLNPATVHNRFKLLTALMLPI